MAQSVKLADDIMAAVRKEAELQGRSIADQVMHWLIIGQTVEKSKTFGYLRISAALQGLLSPDKLMSEEQELWFDQFKVKMTKPSKQERALYAKRRKQGRGVGISVSGGDH